jgi:DNA mismatch repair protein MutL
MNRIIKLPPELIAKIAAGEVIERPGFAVKELIENSIDANATQIKIILEDAGFRKIEVIDNGVGMSKEDLLESFKIHTTSKVITAENLVGIKTLGFRGEALASIAASANLTIQSRLRKNNGGNKITIRNGRLEKVSTVGMAEGTSVTVENIFSQLPARKKFLKSKVIELRFILEIVSNFAISYPQIKFNLTHNKKTLLDFFTSDNSFNRIKNLLGETIFQNLIPFNYEDSYLKISGYLAKPQTTSSNANKQYIFINNRKVTDKMVSLAVKEIFGNLIDSKSFPIFILFLEIPPELVDVNIHPRKEQVAFINQKTVFDNIQKAVLNTLLENNLTFSKEKSFTKLTESFAGQFLKENVIPWDIRPKLEINLEEVIQLHNLYLVVQTKDGVLYIDQHGAHERILYEQFLEEFKDSKAKNQKFYLSDSFTTEFSLLETGIIKENLGLLKNLGFELEEFGKNSFKVLAIPSLFRDRDIQELLNSLVADLENGEIKDLDTKTDQMLKYLACRSAIMRGESLTKKQAKDLIKKLEETPNNYTCPHGRPTKFLINLEEINKYFKRN